MDHRAGLVVDAQRLAHLLDRRGAHLDAVHPVDPRLQYRIDVVDLAGLGGAQLLGRRLQLGDVVRSEEHTSELQSLMRISYAVFCLKKQQLKKSKTTQQNPYETIIKDKRQHITDTHKTTTQT